jgi:hypothetical protein
MIYVYASAGGYMGEDTPGAFVDAAIPQWMVNRPMEIVMAETDRLPVADNTHNLLQGMNWRTEAIHKRLALVQNDVTNITTRVAGLEGHVSSLQTNLHALVTESRNTNKLLKESMEQRQRLEEHRMQLELEDRDWRRKQEEVKIQKEQEDGVMTRAFIRDAWDVFKSPLANILVFILIYLVATATGVPLPTLTTIAKPAP